MEYALTFDVPGAFIAKKRNAWLANWDGKKKFYSYNADRRLICSYGLKHRVIKALEEEDIQFCEETPSKEVIPYQHLIEYIKTGRQKIPITLDAIQEEACRVLLENSRCSIMLGTASGKTEVFVNAIMCVLKVRPKSRIAIMVPKRVLLRDTFRRVQDHLAYFEGGKYWHKLGVVGDGNKDLDKQITLCTGATAAAASNVNNPEEIIEWRKSLDVLILDEAHNSTAPGWKKVIEESDDFWKLWAVSGKLTYQDVGKKLKQAELESLFGPPLLIGNNRNRQCPVKVVVYDPPAWKNKMADKPLATSLQGEVECSFILPGESKWRRGVRISPDSEGRVPEWMLTVNDRGRTVPDKALYGIYLDGEKVEPLSESVVYDTVTDWGYVECDFRNDWIRELAKTFEAKGEAYLISLSRIRHVRKIYELAKEKGLAVGAILKGMSGKAQQKVVNDLRGEKIKGIVSYWKPIGEGLDIPSLYHLIKADGMVEEQILEQQKGRVQRSFEGKNFGYVHLPSDSHIPVLAAKTRKMVKYFSSSCFC
jgi:superfamily II DNA or RNA helicase